MYVRKYNLVRLTETTYIIVMHDCDRTEQDMYLLVKVKANIDTSIISKCNDPITYKSLLTCAHHITLYALKPCNEYVLPYTYAHKAEI